MGGMDSAYMRHLIAGGETALVEFKVAPPRVVDLATRICGFANGDGGSIILGVADRTWDVVGVKDSAAGDASVVACRRASYSLRPTSRPCSLGGRKG
jgi:predicted HTH transcriptional regulator